MLSSVRICLAWTRLHSSLLQMPSTFIRWSRIIRRMLISIHFAARLVLLTRVIHYVFCFWCQWNHPFNWILLQYPTWISLSDNCSSLSRHLFFISDKIPILRILLLLSSPAFPGWLLFFFASTPLQLRNDFRRHLLNPSLSFAGLLPG